MAARQFEADLVTIGFGKGAKTLAAAVGARGRRVVMIERSAQMYGGTCINIGCVPTKSLVFQAEHLQQTGRATRPIRGSTPTRCTRRPN